MIRAFATLLLIGLHAATIHAAVININSATDILAPSTRGNANTTYFGWELFDNSGDGVPGGIVNDTTPDIGTNPGGVQFITTNGQDHTPFAAPTAATNLYTFTGTAAEAVTVTTSGVLGTGFTTIIAQAISAGGAFGSSFSGIPTFSAINGVSPTLINGLNVNGLEQLLVRWDIPGNQLNYTFNFSGTHQHYSNDKFVVDTFWDANGYQPDIFGVPEPGRATLLAAGLLSLVMRRRRASLEARA